jgi:TolA-binding protein
MTPPDDSQKPPPGDEEPSFAQPEDSAASQPSEEDSGPGTLSQDDLDALLSSGKVDEDEFDDEESPEAGGGGDEGEEFTPSPVVSMQDYNEEMAPLDQDAINALLHAASEEPEAYRETSDESVDVVLREELPEDEDSILSQELLDSLLKEAQSPGQKQESEEEESEEEEEEQPEPKKKAPEKQRPATPPDSEPETKKERKPFFSGRVRRIAYGLAKAGLSAAAGLAAAFFLYDYIEALQMEAAGSEYQQRIEHAERSLEAGDADSTRSIAEEIAASPDVDPPTRAEALFLKAKAMYQALGAGAPTQEAREALDAVEDALEAQPPRARIDELLAWRGDLLARLDQSGETELAQGDEVEAQPQRDRRARLLLESGQADLADGRPDDAESKARALLRDFPRSQYEDEANLLLGRSLSAQGNKAAAEGVLTRLAASLPDDATGAAAAARLAQMAIRDGQPAEAVQILENRLEASMSVQGNDQVYAALAKAHQAAGDRAKAEQALRDLIAFFPDSPHAPKAFVQLAELLRQTGRESEAARLAARAAQRYPDAPETLQLLAQTRLAAGDGLGAAEAFARAEEAGAEDPAGLLQAARLYRQAGQLERAEALFRTLSLKYPTSPQAVSALIERAQTVAEDGRAREALEQLVDLAALTEDTPEHLEALEALGRFYENHELPDLALDVYRDVAQKAAEPAMIARAAEALIRNGEWEEGLLVAERVDASMLDPEQAYEFLNVQGDALLDAAPLRGAALLEQAHQRYPGQRTPEGRRLLLTAYLKAGRKGSARALLDATVTEARRSPAAAAQLPDLAQQWADWTYERGDYPEAVWGYELVEEYTNVLQEEAMWARYQKAGAMLNMGDESGALELLDEIARSQSPWAPYAQMKAQYARQLRQVERSRQRYAAGAAESF